MALLAYKGKLELIRVRDVWRVFGQVQSRFTEAIRVLAAPSFTPTLCTEARAAQAVHGIESRCLQVGCKNYLLDSFGHHARMDQIYLKIRIFWGLLPFYRSERVDSIVTKLGVGQDRN